MAKFKVRYIVFVCLFMMLSFLTACSPKNEGAEVPENQQVIQEQSEVENTITDSSTTEVSSTDKVQPETPESAKPEKQVKTDSTKKEDTETQPEKETKGLLTIEGSGINKALHFSMAELKKMTAAYVEDDFFSLNNWGTKEYFNFKGVSLWYLMSEKAGISENAQTVTITAEDGYEVSYTIDEVKRQDYINEENPEQKYPMIIAWEENGKEYDPGNGYPFRFVVGQKEAGDINKQYWVMNVKTITVE